MNKYPFIKQENIKDCGVTSLQMILQYYKGYENLEYLRYVSNTDKKGVTAYDLINTAKIVGFDAYGIKTTNNEELTLPCIAHVVLDKTRKHFIVIYEINELNKKILIADPASKLKWITIDEFNKITTHVFIILNPIKVTKNKRISIVDYILKIISLNKKTILYIIMFSVLITIFTILYSFNIQFLIKTYNINQLILLSYIFINIYVIKIFAEYFRNKVLIILNKKIESQLISSEYKKIINLPYKYFNNQTTGEIVSKINDLEMIKSFVSKILISLTIDTSFSFMTLIVMFMINYKLSLITLLCALMYIIVSKLYSNIFINKIYDVYDKKVNYNSYLVESISNFETIKGISIESKVYDKYIFHHQQYLESSSLLQKMYNNHFFIKELIYNMFLIAITSLSIYYYQQELMRIGSLITFNLLFAYFITPLKDLFETFIGFKEADMLLNRMSNQLTLNSKLISLKKYDIKFKNFTYSYKSKNNILKNINLHIKEGDKVLLTGISGSGKSTLLKSIKKYIDIENNQIFINDIDINNVDVSYIAYLSQNENVFTDTILNNIVLKRNINETNLLDVLKIVDLNINYNYLLEENGKNISGGQRQRVLLARTMLKKSNIYLLDEAFSQLDVKSERIILEKLFSYFKDKTIIVVSHRTDNIDMFSCHYNLENGEIK